MLYVQDNKRQPKPNKTLASKQTVIIELLHQTQKVPQRLVYRIPGEETVLLSIN